jgi:hypothetical protein
MIMKWNFSRVEAKILKGRRINVRQLVSIYTGCVIPHPQNWRK